MNLLNNLNSYVSKWVALTVDKREVVASASNIKKLDDKVKKERNKNVIYHYVLPYDKSFSP